jgi:hypothetical protein
MIGKRAEARWLTIKFARDRVLKLFVPHARAFKAHFGGGALLARGAHRFERLAGGAVGLGERGLATGKRVGGLFSRRFRARIGRRARRVRESRSGRRRVPPARSVSCLPPASSAIRLCARGRSFQTIALRDCMRRVARAAVSRVMDCAIARASAKAV